MKKYDGYPEEDILNDIFEEMSEGELDYIDEDDIRKIILVEYYLLGVSMEDILAEWELSREEFLEILANNPLSYEELEQYRKELFGEDEVH